MRPPASFEASDEELMAELAGGSEEALGPLYGRYGGLILNLAARSLDRADAEEVAQDVLLTVWRKAAIFDPSRGAFRSWVLQIAHFRILNALRRRSSKPPLEPDLDGDRLAQLPARDPEPAEAAWRAYRRAALEAAFRELPPAQREALGLSLLNGHTHAEIAAELDLPLGTAKTRIRSAMQRIRGSLALRAVALASLALLATWSALYLAARRSLSRSERALTLLTASDVESLRLAAAAGVPPEAHGHYRARAGVETAVLALTYVPPTPDGKSYQCWLRRAGAWISLGTARPDANGNAWIIAECREVAAVPEAVEVTLEPEGGSIAPSGPVVLRWPGS